MPTTLPWIYRVLSGKLLGVCLQSEIGINVDNTAKIYKQWLYLLTQLKIEGLSQSLFKVVFEAIISQITYTAPAGRGYALCIQGRHWLNSKTVC